jgi:hypothetical protein
MLQESACIGGGSFNSHLSITTYEDVFDVMQSTHESLGHPRDYRKNKYALDELYFKIPEQCVKIFLKLCPLCFPAKKQKAKHQIPLKMIYSPEFGYRAQIDLFVHGYSYILRCVDHLSGFAHVACTRTKKAEEINIKLVHILSTAVTLEELQKWMESNGDNWVVGAYLVNHEVNKRSQFNRGEKFSSYNFYYGKTPLGTQSLVRWLKKCESEYGIIAAHLFCNKAQENLKDEINNRRGTKLCNEERR